MTDHQDGEDWGPDWHRRQQILAWASATPARRFAWLEEMLDWMRRRRHVEQTNPPDSQDRP